MLFGKTLEHEASCPDVRLDVSPALKVPGVKAVITKDLPPVIMDSGIGADMTVFAWTGFVTRR
jgi:hypothetical protein